jgi:membrane protein implicated in regulation of membrane protease activity
MDGALDLGIDLDVWPWIWLVVATVFAIFEFTVLAGSFVLLPFSISAFIASLLGFYGVAIEIQWLVFVFGGAVIWILMYRRVQRFVGDNDLPLGVGAERLVGQIGIVTIDIDPDDTTRRGRVSIDGEVWGAVTRRHHPVARGAKVRITEMQGTRVVVEPIESVENQETS